eukprot:TRINITY_DN2871_c0_g1_i2.p1 TRINITY_DN2871_c0_g1~~TRINITY_DN2871_c0_g1_i2.p1  ORF type:complete len:475 (-),score=132.77 TRINITY_DN2871_c0_g1_i2:1363-2787(-)
MENDDILWAHVFFRLAKEKNWEDFQVKYLDLAPEKQFILVNICESRKTLNFLLHYVVGEAPIELIRAIIHAGADPRYPNVRGEDCMFLAIRRKDREVCALVYTAFVTRGVEEWKIRLPLIAEALKDIPDCTFTMQWKLSSWIPFLAMLGPKDTWRVSKMGQNVRVDYSLLGYHNLRSIRGDMSVMFLGEGREMPLPVLVSHDKKMYEGILSMSLRTDPYEVSDAMIAQWEESEKDVPVEGSVSYGDVQQHVSVIIGEKDDPLGMDSIIDPEDMFFADPNALVDTASPSPIDPSRSDPSRVGVASMPVPSQGREDINGNTRPAERVEVHLEEAEVLQKKEMFVDSSTGMNASEWEIKNVRVVAFEGIPSDEGWHVRKTERIYKGKLWMSEDFPITRDHVLTILNIFSPLVDEIQRIRSFLDSDVFPKGFPIKVDVPVFTMTSVILRVTEVSEGAPEDPDLFLIPSSYERLGYQDL